MIKQNGITESRVQDQQINQFEDNFVVKSATQIRNHSFKPPSPIFKLKADTSSFTNLSNSNHNDNVINESKMTNNIAEQLNSPTSRIRRTSTPPFSATFDDPESGILNGKIQTASSQLSLTSRRSNSSSSGSPKLSNRKKKDEKNKSNSSFIKKLSFKFKSASNNSPSERTELTDTGYKKYQNYNSISSTNKNNSTNTSNELLHIRENSLQSKRKTVTTSTQTIDIEYNSNQFATSSNYTNKTTSSNTVDDSASKLNIETMRKVFNVFDSDHDGSITIEDVEKVMNSLQHLKHEIEMPSVEQIKIAFDKFDTNKNGSIEFDEFLEILRCAGSYVEPSDDANVLENNDFTKTTTNNTLKSSNTISKQNDKEDTKSQLQNQTSMTERVKTNMRIMFEQFDKDNDGKITKPELHFVMRNLFPDEVITDQDINTMLRAADLDKNGFIDFDEFANMFMLYSTNNVTTINNNSGIVVVPAPFESNIQAKSVTNLKRADITKSNKSLSRTISRSNSKEDKRSRHPSGQRSEHHSPSNTYKRVVQLFTSSQMMDLKAAFQMFDRNNDQKISEKELYEVMKYLGVQATEKDVKAMIQVVDKNRNGYVDYDEFIQMMTQTHLKPLSDEEELRKTFNIFDIDRNGFISHDEIKKTMAHLGENLTDSEVRDMIRAADKNGDGKIDINEFSGLLNGANAFKSN